MNSDGAKGMVCPIMKSECRGDECMMWRWDEWIPSYRQREGKELHGHCGLAGKATTIKGGWGGES